MAKKRTTKKSPEPDGENAITPDKLLGYFTAAYVLEAVGFLPVWKRERLNSLEFPNCPSWSQAVEDAYKIDRKFVRSVFRLCVARRMGWVRAVRFILLGLGCPDADQRFEEVVNG